MGHRAWQVVILALLLQVAAGAPPPDAVRHYEAGLAAKRAGDPSLAAGELGEAVRIDPDYSDAHWALGWVYAGLRWGPGAVREFNEVVKAAPNGPHAQEAKAAVGRLLPRQVRLSLVGATGRNAQLSISGQFCFRSQDDVPSRLQTATGDTSPLVLPAGSYGFWSLGSWVLAYDANGATVFREQDTAPLRPVEPGRLVWCGDDFDKRPMMVLRRQDRLVAVGLSDGSSRELAAELPAEAMWPCVDDVWNAGAARLFGWPVAGGATRVVTLDGRTADLTPGALDANGSLTATLSPDGQQVLWCQPVGEAAATCALRFGGGEPRRIGPPSHCWWSTPGTVSMLAGDGLYRIGPGDGEPRQLLQAGPAGPLEASAASVSPSGRWVLTPRGDGQWTVVNAADGRELPLPLGSRAYWQRPLDILVAMAAEPPVESRKRGTQAPEFAIFCPDDPDHPGPSGQAWQARLGPDGRLLAVLGGAGLECWATGGAARSQPVPVTVSGNLRLAGDTILVVGGLSGGQLYRAKCD